jgi:hypothetical protein
MFGKTKSLIISAIVVLVIFFIFMFPPSVFNFIPASIFHNIGGLDEYMKEYQFILFFDFWVCLLILFAVYKVIRIVFNDDLDG